MPQRLARLERDAEATKRAILSAAEVIFARDGFEGARVEDIAEEAGCNKALIFRYYGDKLGLYRALVMSLKASGESPVDWLEDLDEANATDPQAVRAYFTRAIRTTFDFYRHHPSIARMMAWEAASCWQTFRQTEMPASFCARMSALRRYLAVAQEHGVIRPEIDATMLIALIQGLVATYLPSIPRSEHMFPDTDFASEEALDRAREQIVQLVLQGTMTTTQES
jgi:TetR/AcrR family transcriptional regulator